MSAVSDCLLRIGAVIHCHPCVARCVTCHHHPPVPSHRTEAMPDLYEIIFPVNCPQANTYKGLVQSPCAVFHTRISFCLVKVPICWLNISPTDFTEKQVDTSETPGRSRGRQFILVKQIRFLSQMIFCFKGAMKWYDKHNFIFGFDIFYWNRNVGWDLSKIVCTSF